MGRRCGSRRNRMPLSIKNLSCNGAPHHIGHSLFSPVCFFFFRYGARQAGVVLDGNEASVGGMDEEWESILLIWVTVNRSFFLDLVVQMFSWGNTSSPLHIRGLSVSNIYLTEPTSILLYRFCPKTIPFHLHAPSLPYPQCIAIPPILPRMTTNTTPSTSHAGPLFFQSWALRGQLSAITEPHTTPPNISPLCPDLGSQQSEARTSNSKTARPRLWAGQSYHKATTPYRLWDAPPEHPFESSDSVQSAGATVPEPSNSRTPIRSSEARKLFRIPDTRASSKNVIDSQSSSQSMSEGELRRNGKRKRPPREPWTSVSEGNLTDTVPPSGYGQQPGTVYDSAGPEPEEEGVEEGSSWSHQLRPKSTPRNNRGKKHFFSRFKSFMKKIGLATSAQVPVELLEPPKGTKTRGLLDRASSALAQMKKQDTSPEITTNTRTTSPHLVPGHHKPADSDSSSVRNLMMGKPPVSTPDSDALYGGEDNKQYLKVEISDPDGPTFLPSEARRISTPPLPSDGPRKGRLRGFFFDYHAPDADESPLEGGDTPGAFVPSSKTVAATRSTGQRDWLSVQLMMEDARESEEHFDLNVPEHLLGSPLCPRSPMHRSGGTGICVYHGRTRLTQ